MICETPLLKQVYDDLVLAGRDGLSIAELAQQFSLQLLDSRTLMKNLCHIGVAVCTVHAKGKGGIQRSVPYSNVAVTIAIFANVI